ncbi:MAG: hypothetical protein L0H84_09835 [Pseudonocardia sp.]|nr:hypothetical protein [Pseudonocardia sp.]
MQRTATRPDLSRYLSVHGPVDVETAAEMLEQAAAKLDAAHAAGVVHGVLGPGAVLLDLEAGTVGVREPSAAPEPDPGFRPPEVIYGAAPGPAADVYAIGALLQLCLTGEPPRPGGPRTSGLPEGIGDVVARAMRTDPEARHATCAAVLADLRRSLSVAQADQPRSRRPGWRRGSAVAALVVAALVGGFLVGRPAWQSRQAGTAARAELVATIGLTGCRDSPGVEIGGPDRVLAAVDCDPGGSGAVTLTYRRYADPAALEDAYRARVAALAPVGGTFCGSDPVPERAQGPYAVHGTYVGSLLCDRASGTPTLTWTIDGLRLLGTATGDDPGALERWRAAHLLHRSWTSEIVRAANATADPVFPNRSEARLLADVPEASRVDCSRLDRQFVQANVGDPEGVTAIACGPVPGAHTVFYFRFAGQQRFADFTGAGPGDAADCRDNPAGFAGSARYTRAGGATGVLGCARQGSRVAVVWTEEVTRTVGFGFGDEPGELLDWWRVAAGPR